MNWQDLLTAFFGDVHTVERTGDLLSGSGTVQGQTVAVIGTTDHAPIGVELALAQARCVLDTVKNFPGRPIVLLVDTQGQRLRYRDEMLGINRYMAHLGCCIALARQRGHRVVGLVYDQALSGGFITSGLMADACYALPDAEIRVMRSNPVFAPGVQNFVAMGGIHSLWQGDLQAQVLAALYAPPQGDARAADGALRGGRKLAAIVAERVRTEAIPA